MRYFPINVRLIIFPCFILIPRFLKVRVVFYKFQVLLILIRIRFLSVCTFSHRISLY